MASTILPIRCYPDPILRTKTTIVEDFNRSLHTLLDNMAHTMYQAEGIGLAAPQVGEIRRVCVVDVSREGLELQEFINPQIIAREGSASGEEGCLSIPEYRDKVDRSAKIVVKAQDRKGQFFELEASNLLAVCLQHEIDHLDGILFIDHLSRLKRELFKRWALKQGWQLE